MYAIIISSLQPRGKTWQTHTTGAHKQTLHYLKCRYKTNLQPKRQTQLAKGIWICSSICSNCQHKHIYWMSRWHLLVLCSAYMIECWRVRKAEKTVVLWKRHYQKSSEILSKMWTKTRTDKMNTEKIKVQPDLQFSSCRQSCFFMFTWSLQRVLTSSHNASN